MKTGKTKKDSCELEIVRNVWKHVASMGDGKRKMSPCLSAIKRAVLCEDRAVWRKKVVRVANQIADPDGGFVEHGSISIKKAPGKWRVSNGDMCFWGDFMLFLGRELPDFEVQLRYLSNDLVRRRTWQSYERYVANGGIRPEHRKLLSRLRWEMDMFHGEWVSLYVDGKRPFGNSSREIDMMEALGWEDGQDDDGGIDGGVVERLWDLFDELRFAIVDVLAAE